MSGLKKNKLLFSVLAALIFIAGSVFYWFQYSSPDGKKMDLVTAIVTGILAIIKIIDAIEYSRKKASIENKN